MLLITTAFAVAAASASVFLPHPLDKDEWGLRIHNPTIRSPFLVGESLEHVVFEITLLNFSKETREHDPFVDAKRFGDLDLTITQPNGKWLRSMAGPYDGTRSVVPQKMKLGTGHHTSHEFRFADFGYSKLNQLGRYRVDASFKIDGKKISAPPIVFEVVEILQDAILVSRPVPLEGWEAARPPDERSRPLIQQVKIGERTLLIYRRYYGAKWGGVVDFTARIAELPGKVLDMKVEGAFGDGNPLTITYREATYIKWPTTHVINSVGGRPWTAEEEKRRQEKLKRAGQPAEKK